MIFRLFNIFRLFGRYRLDSYIDKRYCPGWILFLFKLNPWRLFPVKSLTRGERLRCLLEALGPIFVKFGQVLSTRRDMLPTDIADELAKLQDNVSAFDYTLARDIIEKNLEASITDLFATFENRPLASASVAQVHAATLKDGSDVVVKVIRPNIDALILKDIRLMYLLAGIVSHIWSEGPRLRANEVVAEFEHTIFQELDMRIEAANASHLHNNFKDSALIYVPQVYWDYIGPSVLVTERIYGIPISDIETLKKNNVNLKKLAERGVEIFFTQVFRDSFFHADMHPGNVFVDISDPDNPKYCAVDFGIMGTLSESDQRYLAENFLAFFNRDYRRVAVLHVQSGWVPADTRVDQFEAAIRTVTEPIFDLPLGEISFARLLIQLFHTASRFNMPVQPQLILLQKTLVNIEGLGRELYPELDLWTTAKPFLEKWIKEKLSIKTFFKNVRQLAPYWLEKAPEMPELIYRALNQTSIPSTNLKKTPDKSNHNLLWIAVGGTILATVAVFGLAIEQLMHAPKPLLYTSALLCVTGVVTLTVAAVKR